MVSVATTAEARNINLLLNTGAMPIRVPRLQRPYSWDTSETRELWNDLIAFHERFPGNTLVGHEYFLGSIVGQSREIDGLTTLEVLDGQQRLATLTILLATLRDVLAQSSGQRAQTAQSGLLVTRWSLGSPPLGTSSAAYATA